MITYTYTYTYAYTYTCTYTCTYLSDIDQSQPSSNKLPLPSPPTHLCPQVATAILEAAPDTVNAPLRDGSTPLLLAAQEGKTEMVELLVKKKVCVRACVLGVMFVRFH